MTDWIRVDYTSDETYAATLPPHGVRIEMLRYAGHPIWHHLKGTCRHLSSFHSVHIAPPGSKLVIAASCDIGDGVPGSAYYGVQGPLDGWPETPDAPTDWWRPL